MTENKAKPIMPASHWDNLYRKAGQAPQLRYRKWELPFHAELADHLSEFCRTRPIRFLEVGCAPAKFMIYYHQVFGWEVAGIELSEAGLDRAKESLVANHIEARLYAGDIFKIEPECQYDVVGSFGLVEHFDDPLPCYRAMARWIRPGGAMIVTVPNLIGPIGRAMRFRNYERYLQHQRFSPEDLANHCREAGLQVSYSGLVGNLCIPYLFESSNSTRLQRLANQLPRMVNGLVRRAATIIKRPIKLGSLTISAGCVAFKDE